MQREKCKEADDGVNSKDGHEDGEASLSEPFARALLGDFARREADAANNDEGEGKDIGDVKHFDDPGAETGAELAVPDPLGVISTSEKIQVVSQRVKCHTLL